MHFYKSEKMKTASPPLPTNGEFVQIGEAVLHVITFYWGNVEAAIVIAKDL
jgi:hypothetical protein